MIYEYEHQCHEMTVYTIDDAAVTRDGVAEIFYFKSAFEARGEEPSEGGDERDEDGDQEGVELEW